MQKVTIFTVVLLLQFVTRICYSQPLPCEKTMEESLKQTAEMLNKQETKDLWNVALNAPLIIINHIENKMYFTAIENGKVQPLKEEAWNNKIPLANSIFEYEGKKYVIIVHAALMFSPCEERLNLLAHEIFHLHQNGLGIQNTMSANFYMDEIEGRALLQIEMKALQQALDRDTQSVHDALYVRAYRQSLYPRNNEEMYELNEGLAEYTGAKLTKANMQQYVRSRLNYDINAGYSNSFGYATGAAYAVILDGLYPKWRYDKDLGKGMTFLLKKSNPQYAVTVENTYLNRLLSKYQHDKILTDEKEALKSFCDIAAFEKLLDPKTPKLRLMNNGVNFSYNPNDRVIALNNAVLLRNITLMGEWGQISVKSGIVRLNDWSAFYLLPPKEITANVIQGSDYEIRLNKGWKVVEQNGMYNIENGE